MVPAGLNIRIKIDRLIAIVLFADMLAAVFSRVYACAAGDVALPPPVTSVRIAVSASFFCKIMVADIAF